MIRRKIEVKQEHITEAIRTASVGDPPRMDRSDYCPIRQALGEGWRVGYEQAIKPGERILYLSRRAMDFVAKFDRFLDSGRQGLPPGPQNFNVAVGWTQQPHMPFDPV